MQERVLFRCYLQHFSLEEEEWKCLCTSQKGDHVTKQSHCNAGWQSSRVPGIPENLSAT